MIKEINRKIGTKGGDQRDKEGSLQLKGNIYRLWRYMFFDYFLDEKINFPKDFSKIYKKLSSPLPKIDPQKFDKSGGGEYN